VPVIVLNLRRPQYTDLWFTTGAATGRGAWLAAGRGPRGWSDGADDPTDLVDPIIVDFLDGLGRGRTGDQEAR
jgi:hypothetical protein